MFDSSQSQYLSRTFGMPTDGRKFTWSGWVKNTTQSNYINLLTSGTPTGELLLNGNTLVFYDAALGGTLRQSLAYYRDPSAWLHIVFVFDSTNITDQQRCRLYVNGTEITAWAQNNSITPNAVPNLGSSGNFQIGSNGGGTAYADGYLSDNYFVD